MNHFNFNTKKKYAHLNLEHYEYIQFELQRFVKDIKTNKTAFMKKLAQTINTSLDNLYKIIADGTVLIQNYDLSNRKEFSALASFNARSKHNKKSNHFKLDPVSRTLIKKVNIN